MLPVPSTHTRCSAQLTRHVSTAHTPTCKQAIMVMTRRSSKKAERYNNARLYCFPQVHHHITNVTVGPKVQLMASKSRRMSTRRHSRRYAPLIFHTPHTTHHAIHHTPHTTPALSHKRYTHGTRKYTYAHALLYMEVTCVHMVGWSR
jgi:hypothetical protein